MRSAGARAAALLLALSLGTYGCELVSSLSPFWIGTQDYSSDNFNVNGVWAGNTGTGGTAKFQVGNDTVSNLLFTHVEGACTLTFEAATPEDRVVDNVFTVEILLNQGKFVVTGRFASANAASGTYVFEALQTGGCPSAGTGTFTAVKTSL